MTINVGLCVGLSELATQVRSRTVHALSAAEPSMLMWVPPGTSNHMLWHAGHALWVADILTIEPITHQSELPAGWAATFGEGSQPGRNSNWPEGLEVCELLEKQLARVQALFADSASSIGLRALETSPASGWQLLPGIIHGWHDEARHQGEMHLLSKLYQHRHK
jgi:hypothetical protein